MNHADGSRLQITGKRKSLFRPGRYTIFPCKYCVATPPGLNRLFVFQGDGEMARCKRGMLCFS